MKQDEYTGFEQGPIRPPSESRSLLIRLTRNCPWNRCTFCPVYKGKRFSLRSGDSIIKDIDAIHFHLTAIVEEAEKNNSVDMEKINAMFHNLDSGDRVAFNSAWHWFSSGMESIFLQDANSLIMKPDDLVAVLDHLKACFPMVKRITSYARSHTIARIKPHDLARIAGAGLNRIHIGLESGSDKVLEMVKKGATQAMHIKAGRMVKDAGMELSEYMMPGLGGVELSREHALESAHALNLINPDFIRLRTLALPGKSPLAEAHDQGEFERCTDLMIARELKLFLESLDGITSFIKSDHILNLLETVEGRMPHDKARMVAAVDSFLDMAPGQRVVYQVGRRMGLFRGPADMSDPRLVGQAEEACRLHGVTVDNVDTVIDGLMKRFV
ncbi:MAG: radical SAM protein [Desulfobacteraceae bacterium]|nr:radical SAM protein [Desulfobacteraceae bacterium]